MDRMSREIEQYKEFRIEYNLLLHQNDFDDFGWAFQVLEDSTLRFRLVIKTAGSLPTEANKKAVFTWGIEKIHFLLDTGSYTKEKDYCYKWVDLPNNSAPKKVDCKGFINKGV
jgi:hypothetical protein